MIGECDLIILPTGSSRADLVPTLALARRLSEIKHDAAGPIFALCRVITDSEVAEARSVIGMGWVHHARRRADRTTQLPRRAECRPQRQRDRVSVAQRQSPRAHPRSLIGWMAEANASIGYMACRFIITCRTGNYRYHPPAI
jgi:hypothetical protein